MTFYHFINEILSSSLPQQEKLYIKTNKKILLFTKFKLLQKRFQTTKEKQWKD